MDVGTQHAYDLYYELGDSMKKEVGTSNLPLTSKEHVFGLFEHLDSVIDYFAENNNVGGILALCTYIAGLEHNMEEEVNMEYRNILAKIVQKKELLLLDQITAEERNKMDLS